MLWLMFHNNVKFYNNNSNSAAIIICELNHFKELTQTFQISYTAKDGC